jgi:Tfp pilus assembly protein PilF
MLQRKILRKFGYCRYPTIIFLVLSIYWPGCAHCQGAIFGEGREQPGETTGAIRGSVHFPTSPTSMQVKVTARSINTGVTRSVLTDSSGHFEFLDLAAGSYTISIDENGYLPVSTTAKADLSSSPISLDLMPANSTNSRETKGAIISVHELKIPEKARSEFDKGEQRLDAKDPAGSLRFFNKAIQKSPHFYEAYYELGLAQVRLGQTDDASRSFQSAIDLSEGRFPLAEFAYGLLLCKRKDTKDAEQVVRRGLDHDEAVAEGHLVLGVVMLQEQRPGKAEHEAREALLRDPRMANAYLVLAAAHDERKAYTEEVQDLTAYLQLQPSGPESENTRKLLETTRQLADKGYKRQRQ